MNMVAFISLVVVIASVEEDHAGKYRRMEEEARRERMQDWSTRVPQYDLSKSDQAHLEKDRILVSNESYRQIFKAYEENDHCPYFITSDSLLNAYHVLYGESVRRMELQLAAKGSEILGFMLKNLDGLDRQLKGNPALAKAANRRAQIVLGIALRLMNEDFRFKDRKLDRLIGDEVKRIEKGTGVFRPEWLGDSAVQGLDYSRYKPRGFYTQTEELQRYFRAVAWLQSIPFRLKNDEEFLSILMLANSLHGKHFDHWTEQRPYARFFDAYSLFIGLPDDWSLATELESGQTGNGYFSYDLAGEWFTEGSRKYRLEEYAGRPLINDQVVDGEDSIGPHYRIISAYRTPASILFQRTTDNREFERSFPTGLEVAVALGSGFARKALLDPQKDKLLETIADAKTYFCGDSLYFQYLEALRLLIDEPEPDAPDFMRNEAWQAKSCNTVLGGWAQLRSTWILHSKQAVYFFGAHTLPSGFVEPEPEFFGHMADLARQTRATLRLSGAFDYSESRREKQSFGIKIAEPDFEIEALWKRFEETSRALQVIAHKQLRGVELIDTENHVIKGYGSILKEIMLHRGDTPARDNAPRVADIFSNPQAMRYLHVGVGRPRKLYVLYPWKGNHVLCTGAVMPYYEFTSKERLNREGWKGLLDSGNRPKGPEWFQPLESTQPVMAAKEME